MITGNWRMLLYMFILIWSSNLSEGATPIFRSPAYFPTLNDGSPPGTHVTTVQADDSDPQHVVTYSLKSDSTNPQNKEYFSINSTSGAITLTKTVDREVSAVLKFVAVAGDGSLQGTAKVFCNILDLNDNFPMFQNLPYKVNISEAINVGDIVLTVSASDRDSSDNGNNQIVYRITEGNVDDAFEIAALSGDITLQKALDFESNAFYELNVTATDRYGFPTGNLNWTLVTIMVTNEDDHGAKFSNVLYEVLIEKDTPKGMEILRVHAEDQDAIKDSIQYSIFADSNPDETFLINNLTGILTITKNLTQNAYNLIVMATTTHHSPAVALVKVFVGAMPNKTFQASVLEDEANIAAFNLTILEQNFNVSDPLFLIATGDSGDRFVINNAAKEIKVGPQGLDREETKIYSLVIELRKNGKHKGFAKLNIHVLDINDNAPVFQNPSSVSVPEDMREGNVVITLTANDRDAGNNGTVVYKIITGNEQGLFALNNQSGEITLVKQLNYETADQQVLNVSASDMGEPQRLTFTDVTIHVTDVNDNSPVLQQRNIHVFLPEDSSVGSFVVRVNATDDDTGENARITYHIVEGAADKFTINNSTGIITTTRQFDTETGSLQYTIVVMSRDGGQFPRHDVGFVLVTVTNINEHSPIISPLSYVGGVYKETSYYSLVTAVKATDPDGDEINSVTYKLVSGNSGEMFHVEPDTGHVRTAASLADLEGSKYTLTVSASDGGNPEKVSAELAVVDIFVLRDEDAVTMKAGIIPHEITNNREEFLSMLGDLSGASNIFIKYLQEETGERATLITFHAVKDKQAMRASEITSSILDHQHLLESTFKKWNITWYQSIEEPSVAARQGSEDELSAAAGAMICLGVIIFVIGIIILIILIRRKRAGKAPFKRRRSPRVTFKDVPDYIYPTQTAGPPNQVEAAQEAQEVILHLPQEGDSSSQEGSDTGLTGDGFGDVLNFTNFAYAARAARKDYECDQNEMNDLNLSSFFPPPPGHPPPDKSNIDDEYDKKSDEGDSNQIPDVSRSVSEEGSESPEMLRPDDGDYSDVTMLSHSPSDSTTGSTDLLVTAYPNFANGSFLNRFSLGEETTEL